MPTREPTGAGASEGASKATSAADTTTRLKQSIRTLEAEFEARQVRSRLGERAMSTCVALAYRRAIEQRAKDLQRLQDSRPARKT